MENCHYFAKIQIKLTQQKHEYAVNQFLNRTDKHTIKNPVKYKYKGGWLLTTTWFPVSSIPLWGKFSAQVYKLPSQVVGPGTRLLSKQSAKNPDLLQEQV